MVQRPLATRTFMADSSWKWFKTMIYFIPSLNSISSGPAYTFFRGETLSITDYIITDARHAHLTIQCQTYDHHPLNFSDHLPLSLTLSIMSNSNSTLSTSRSKPRLNWHAASADGSAEAYAKCVDEIVRPYLCRTYNSIYSLDKDILEVSIPHFFKLPHQLFPHGSSKSARNNSPTTQN